MTLTELKKALVDGGCLVKPKQAEAFTLISSFAALQADEARMASSTWLAWCETALRAQDVPAALRAVVTKARKPERDRRREELRSAIAALQEEMDALPPAALVG